MENNKKYREIYERMMFSQFKLSGLRPRIRRRCETVVSCVYPSGCFGGDRLCGPAVRLSLRDREVRGSIPGRVKPRTLKLVLAADMPSVWHYGFSAKSGQPGVMII
ncbi:hypothetical protein ElyMa_002619100 [Elysia marginata]|uniref:Uncharacterized protein n=1 Tax=Elysia marginata TaxID=1093978 RepID=A0AAV4H4S4_9GAST|nr:hypothetical protein ElyMa_002619100 [Elysia marginata]